MYFLPIITSIEIATPRIPNESALVRSILERSISITGIHRIRSVNIRINNGNVVLIISMQSSNELLHPCSRICVLVVSEITIELIDVDIIPHALKWDIRFSIRVHDALDDGYILVSPATLVEAKRPELLHCWRAGTASLKLTNSL